MRKWTIAIEEIRFVYHGGPYVDVCLGPRAFDVINVWDYADDRPTLSGRSQFVAACREWMREYADDYRRNGYGL